MIAHQKVRMWILVTCLELSGKLVVVGTGLQSLQVEIHEEFAVGMLSFGNLGATPRWSLWTCTFACVHSPRKGPKVLLASVTGCIGRGRK